MEDGLLTKFITALRATATSGIVIISGEADVWKL